VGWIDTDDAWARGQLLWSDHAQLGHLRGQAVAQQVGGLDRAVEQLRPFAYELAAGPVDARQQQRGGAGGFLELETELQPLGVDPVGADGHRDAHRWTQYRRLLGSAAGHARQAGRLRFCVRAPGDCGLRAAQPRRPARRGNGDGRDAKRIADEERGAAQRIVATWDAAIDAALEKVGAR